MKTTLRYLTAVERVMELNISGFEGPRTSKVYFDLYLMVNSPTFNKIYCMVMSPVPKIESVELVSLTWDEQLGHSLPKVALRTDTHGFEPWLGSNVRRVLLRSRVVQSILEKHAAYRR